MPALVLKTTRAGAEILVFGGLGPQLDQGLLLGDHPGKIVRLWERRLVINHHAKSLSQGYVFDGLNGDADLTIGAILQAGDEDGNQFLYRGSPRIDSGMRCVSCGHIQVPKLDAFKMSVCRGCGRWNAMAVPIEFYYIHNTPAMIAKQREADRLAELAALEKEQAAAKDTAPKEKEAVLS
jgi:hypothetical protein